MAKASPAKRSGTRPAALIQGARQLPMAHLSIRVPWHDAGWDGTLCRNPRENTSCLVLKRIAEHKDDGWEAGCAGKTWEELGGAKLPPCVHERASFLSAREFVRAANHPYKGSDPLYDKFLETPFRHVPFSAACIPFRWMLKEFVEGNARKGIRSIVDDLSLGYSPEREPSIQFATDFVQEFQNQRVLLDTVTVHGFSG